MTKLNSTFARSLRPRHVFLSGLVLLTIAFVSNWNSPLGGVHAVRQADTLFAGWSYCTEGAEFLRPRVAHRGAGTGVNIGEFPLASAVFAIPCRVTGEWSEGAVKAVVLLILFLNTLTWGLFVRRRWPDLWPGWGWFGLIWVFNTHALLHFTIALPDPLALTLIALSGLAFLSESALARIAGVALFVIAFGMRPYFIPLLFLVVPRWSWRGLTFALCGLFYLVWFKWWILQSEFPYYATDATSFAETLQKLVPIAGALAEAVVRNATNIVGLFFVVLFWRKTPDRFLIGLTLLSFAMVLALRAPMIISHHYYLGAAFALLAIMMALGARTAPTWTGALFLLIGVVNVQHHWHNKTRPTFLKIQSELARQGVGPTDKLAVYEGDVSAATPYLYWAKRTGWVFHENEDRGPSQCPDGAQWLLHPVDGSPAIERCQK